MGHYKSLCGDVQNGEEVEWRGGKRKCCLEGEMRKKRKESKRENVMDRIQV